MKKNTQRAQHILRQTGLLSADEAGGLHRTQDRWLAQKAK